MADTLLWKDFAKQENCDNCPLLEAEICPGGMASYGGVLVEPPCWSFDDDTDLYQWIEDYFDGLRRYEELEERKLKEERKRKERAQKAAETRRKMQWYCRDEIYELKQAQKALTAQENLESFSQSFAEAINFANEMFRYKERVAVKPQISEEVKALRIRVERAKAAFEAKRNDFYKSKEDGEKNHA